MLKPLGLVTNKIEISRVKFTCFYHQAELPQLSVAALTQLLLSPHPCRPIAICFHSQLVRTARYTKAAYLLVVVR